MKKLLLLMLAIMPLTFICCSSDDDDSNGNSSKIVGVWYETFYWATGNGTGDANTWHTWGFVPGYCHEFKADKTYKKWSSLSAYKEGKEPTITGTYTFDGKNLAVNGGFKRAVEFTENGNGFQWEQTAICVRYSPY